MTQQASPADIKALSDHIKANKSAIPTPSQNAFCKDWPAIKQGLQLLLTILQSVPGISMFAGFAVNLVISAGDAVSQAICGSAKP